MLKNVRYDYNSKAFVISVNGTDRAMNEQERVRFLKIIVRLMIALHVASLGKVSAKQRQEIADHEKTKAERRMMRRPGKLVYALNRMAERVLSEHHRRSKGGEDVDMKNDYE